MRNERGGTALKLEPSGPRIGSQLNSKMQTILLVHCDDSYRITTKWFLNLFGYTVEPISSAEEALAIFDPNVHDLVVTDNSMPGMSGGEMAHIIKMRSAGTPVVMYSDSSPQDASCLDLVLQRPFDLMRLRDGINELLIPSEANAIRSL